MTEQNHADRAHALLGASKATQWINCPPSARLQDGIPDKRSEYADEGTAAHELSELVIKRELGIMPESITVDIAMFEATNKYFDGDMAHYVGVYVDEVMERYHNALASTPDAIIQLEERLDFSEWVPDGFGTGDVVIIADKTMEIIDLKYGKGVAVSAIGNSQMKLYALGALFAYDFLYDIQEIRMTIVQPRIFGDGISTDTITVEELMEWAETVVVPAAKLADAGEGDFKAGEHCRWCKVKGNCRARAEENMAALAHEFKDPRLLSNEEIGQILTIAEQLQTWAKNVQEFAYEQALSGEKVPGWKIVEGRSNRTIPDTATAMAILAAAGKPTDVYLKPKAMLGIGDLEKKVGKKHLDNLIGHLITKPAGKPVLVVESDKRQELNSLSSDFEGEDFDA